jgi:exopolyphosphatase/guanosine-5'-triphosphate,3'-diphosphate pyrophosphatase
MRIAIIDLGTNSVRFDIVQTQSSRKSNIRTRTGKPNKVRFQRLYREKLMIRLGQNLFSGGKLDPRAIHRTLEAFEEFKKTSRRMHVTEVLAFGTSALRDASDADDLLAEIQKKTGIEVKVISGEQEAQLIALGILANENPEHLKGTVALIDIGGGSTEISICKKAALLHGESFAVGAARIQQVYLKTSPPKASKKHGQLAVERALESVETTLKASGFLKGNWKIRRALGSSGTIRAVAKLLQANEIRLKELIELNRRLAEMDTTELLGLPGMEPKRVDMILAGSLILEAAMRVLRVEVVLPTEFSLRDGILAHELPALISTSINQGRTGSRKRGGRGGIDGSFDALQAAYLRLGGTPEGAGRWLLFAEGIFHSLKSLHQLPPSWLSYFKAAVLMRNVGELISPRNVEAHSSYVVRHLDLPFMQKWEVNLIADLCLARGYGPAQEALRTVEIAGLPSREAARIFLRMGGLLYLVDAFSEQSTLRQNSLKLTRKRGWAAIEFKRQELFALDAVRIQQRQEALEKFFECSLQFRNLL